VKEKAIAIIFSFVVSNCFAQVGEWTWMNGDNFIQSCGHFGVQGVADSLNTPPAFYEPCEWQDQQGNFWLYGGVSWCLGNGSDLWKYDSNTNRWTWVKGDSSINSLGHYGTQGIPSPLNYPSCKGWGTPTWVDNNNNLWLYGGNIGYDDLWKYNISNNEWTWMKGDTTASPFFQLIPPVYGTFQVPSPLNTPGTRNEVTTSWTDNNGDLWLFGGNGADSNLHYTNYNDLWKFDITINQWVWMAGSNIPNDTGYYGIKGVASALNRPPARTAYAKWKDNAGNFYLFGGLRYDVNSSCALKGYNDVWKYEIANNNWVWIGGDSAFNTSGNYSPECVTTSLNIPRNSHENRATSYDSNGNVYIFGSIGATCNTYTSVRNEIWHYSMIHNEWTLIQPNSPINWGVKGISSPTNAPPKKFGSISWLKNNEFWVFGGSEYGNGDSYNDMWKFRIDTSCIPSGIHENNQTVEHLIFPNPTNFSFTISFELSTKENIELRIFNILGEVIYFSKEENTTGKFKKEINVQKLSKGIYFLQAKMNDRIINEKVVKQ